MGGANELLHELWEYVVEGVLLSSLEYAGPKGDAARSTLPANAKLVWTVWAGSHFEAMTRYFERQGWGTYTAEHSADHEPYPDEWVQEQRQFLALRESETQT